MVPMKVQWFCPELFLNFMSGPKGTSAWPTTSVESDGALISAEKGTLRTTGKGLTSTFNEVSKKPGAAQPERNKNQVTIPIILLAPF